MLVVAVSVWTNRRSVVSRASVRVGFLRWWAAAAGAAGLVLRVVLAVVVVCRGAAGLLLVAYGVWLAWPPGGPIVVGVGLLADRLADERPKREASE